MSSGYRELYEFGHFRLDVQEHRLETTSGEKVPPIPDKAFLTLIHLVRNRGSLQTKQELLAAIWPDAIVEENNLDKAIHTIRHALGEDEEHKYIETVRKHGYRFVAEVRETAGSAGPARPSTTIVVKKPETVREDVNRSDPSVLVGDLAKARLSLSGQHVLFDLVDNSKGEADPTEPGEQKDRINEPVEPISTPRPRRQIRWILFTCIGVILMAGILGSSLFWRSEPPRPASTFTFRRITAAGGTARTTISPSGEQAAVVINNALVSVDLVSGNERQLVPAAPGVVILKVAFTPDGSRIYYGSRPVDATLITVYSVPAGGGEPTKVFEDTYSSISFSPDGSKLTFLRRYPELNEYAILTANSDGSNLAKLVSSRLPDRFEGTPEWSPDGKTILCSSISVEGGFHFAIARVSVDSGRVDFVPDQRWVGLNSIVWMRDSRRIVVAGQDEESSTAQIWQVDIQSGERARLSNDPYVYESISGTSDGSKLAALRVRQSSQVWRLGDGATQLTAGFDNADGVGGLAWSGDGSILYHSRASGTNAIWRMREDGSNAAPITPDQASGFAISPDGRFLVFQGKQSEAHLGLQMLDLVNRSERSLTRNITAMSPSFFPDGKRVVFSVYDKKLSLYEMSVDGGKPTLLNEEFRAAMVPSVSPSGKFIAFGINRVEGGRLQTGIAVLDVETKRVISTFPVKLTSTVYEEATLQWEDDESAIYFILLENSVSNIMKLRLSDGSLSNVTNFTEGRIFNFALEPKGKRLLAARGQLEKEATLIKLNSGN